MFGLWQNVSGVPKGGIAVKGDSNMPSKQNLLWRFLQKWMIFTVVNDGKPYYVFFDDGKDKMRLKKPINTPYFAARIGPRDLVFSAVTDLSDPESLLISGDFSKTEYSWLKIHAMSCDRYNNITLI